MHRYVVAFVVLVFSNVSYGTRELPHPRYASVENLLVPPEVDCALRAFAIEMAAYIAPDAAKANWTALTKSAFQMNQCNGTANTSFEPPKSAKPFQTAPPMQRGTCEHTVFVHGLKGNDLFDGTFDRPMRTIKSALTHTRRLRAMHGSQSIICMTIRGGTYYLGTNATTTSSQIGVIALTSNDSNLIIENYPGELVTLSGGTELKLQWSVHAKTALGATIMKAQVPDSINLDQFNELYIDGTRAIVAKYPNGDPSTQGIYAANPGYTYDVQGWAPPVHSPSTDIYIQSPSRAGTVFPNYQLGVGGGASVFDPPENFWSTASPPAGGNYAVPTGLTAKSGALPNLDKWSNASTGFVHTFHGGYWGGWIFQIASSSAADNSIKFSRGGFQEARGWGGGGPIYVSNIFEELDSANEWFLDKTTRTLYFMPNDTMPNTFVASQVPCIISVSGGDIEDPAQNIVIQGLTFTQTTNTYMRGYMVPSGGDWSVHRGGTIFLKNTKNVTIAHSLFTQLGSNGIAVIDYNDATTISSNEFVWLGDSGIVLVGTTNGIDGFSVKSQPMNTLIQSNIFHELGIYVKQSAPLLIAVSRSVSVIGNLVFNIPRAGVNINDGFYGNHTLAHNVMFNTVRETSDHGPINSWDRQPYLTDSVQQGVPSLWQHTNYIHHNLLFNNYRSVWPIDHDDGSCFYEDSYNFQVYGGKKNYLGHSKTDHHEIYVYADSNGGGFGSNSCLGDYNPQPGASGWNETWVNNICTLYSSPIPYHIDGCETTHLYAPYLANNTIFVPPGSEVAFMCKVNGQDQRLSLQQWQANGVDVGTVVETTPDVQTIIGWGRKMLQDSM